VAGVIKLEWRARHLHPDPGAARSDKPFMMPIEDVFLDLGAGTV